MTNNTALQLLQALLAERGIPLPASSGDAVTDTRRLIQTALAIGMDDMPVELERALAETFDAVAASCRETEG